MEKDFNKWNQKKKKFHRRIIRRDLFFYEREVWWCSLGLNIGVETDGKNEEFERPVLILKKFNSEMIWVLPLTSKQKNGPHFLKIKHDRGFSWVCLSQIRTVSTKRLLRKIGMISDADFRFVREKIASYITIGPRIAARSSEAEATST